MWRVDLTRPRWRGRFSVDRGAAWGRLHLTQHYALRAVTRHLTNMRCQHFFVVMFASTANTEGTNNIK